MLLCPGSRADGSGNAAHSVGTSGPLADVVLVGALASGCHANNVAAAATAAAAADAAAGPALAGPACRRHKRCHSAGDASPSPLLAVAGPLARRSQLEDLAEAAGAASRRHTLTVAMVMVAPPGSPAAAVPSSPRSIGAGSSATAADAPGSQAPPATEAASSTPLEGAVMASGAAAGSQVAAGGAAAGSQVAGGGAAPGIQVAAGGTAACGAAVANAAGSGALVDLAGCPALLVNPDGTEQLVLLGSGQPAAATAAEGGPGAGAPSGMQAEPAAPSYQVGCGSASLHAPLPRGSRAASWCTSIGRAPAGEGRS